jgi:hypothetical protein
VFCQELLQKLAGEAIGGDSKTEKLHVRRNPLKNWSRFGHFSFNSSLTRIL